MARMVRHEATGPSEVKPQDKSVWICACGLSKNLPYCDGSHKTARQQETDPAKLYVYDKTRARIIETRADQ